MLNINKAIQTLISGVTLKIYTNILPENVLPAGVINSSILVDYTKDGYSNVSNSVTLTIMGTSYQDALNIAISINNILNCYSGTVNDIRIVDCWLVSCDENYSEDCFKQILTYQVITR